jgi:phosphomannomutase
MELCADEHPSQDRPELPDSIFRAYDIRGTVPEFLNAETAYWIGRAIGSQSLAQANPTYRSAVTAACPARSWSNN